MTSKDDEFSEDNNSRGELSELERQFIGSGDTGDDEFDEELRELVQTRNRGSVLRPILMIIVIFLIVSVISGWSDELSYFFTDSEPVQVGDVASFGQRAAEEPDWEPPLEHNSFVSIEGMPIRMTSASEGNYEFFQLMGAQVYVQRQIERDEDDSLLEEGRTLPRRDIGPTIPVDEHRSMYSGEGRLISFEAAPDRVAGLKQFYGQRYNVRYCEDLSDHQIQDLEQQYLERRRHNWRNRYQQADDEQRERRGLTPEPTEQQEQQMLQRNPVCVHAYLVQDGTVPTDKWWYLLFSVLLGTFAVYSGFKLVRWFQHWLKP